MRKSAFILFFFTFNLLAAQNIRVLDSKSKSPLPGASIELKLIEGNSIFLGSDENGDATANSHHFEKQKYALLKVSYIGYQMYLDTLFSGENKIILLQPKDYLIDDVVVTAQYSPTSVENSVHKIKVISRQKIDDMAAVNLRDVLTNELNIRISQDNVLGSGMSLQGISGQNVKILIDGVPVIGRMDGQIDLNQINLNNVERIELIEGPLSVNYGSNALAGTINIITKKHQDEKLSLGINSYTENIGTYNLETNIGFTFHRKKLF